MISPPAATAQAVRTLLDARPPLHLHLSLLLGNLRQEEKHRPQIKELQQQWQQEVLTAVGIQPRLRIEIGI